MACITYRKCWGSKIVHISCQIQIQANKEPCREIFQVLRWGNICTNRFFRIVYRGDLWMTRSEAELAIQNGWNLTEPLPEKVLFDRYPALLFLGGNGNHSVIYKSLSLSFCLSAQEAYGACSQLAASKNWALWYLRPKIHMFQHVLPLRCTGSYTWGLGVGIDIIQFPCVQP